MNVAKEIGAALKHYRDRAGLSVRQAADLIGTGYGYISRVERGEVEPSITAIGRFAAAYKVSVRAILKKAGII